MVVSIDSLRKKVYEAWIKNPYTTAKKICKDEQLPYKEKGNYINRLLSEFRSYHQFASPEKAHRLEHRVFEWGEIPRVYEGDGELPLELWRVGWRVVRNKGEMWAFRDPKGVGTVHWYQGGLVRLYLKGEVQFAKAKELFCRAFSWFTSEQLKKYLDVPLKEVYKKWIFEVGQPVGRFDIRQFERSHGIRIFTDGSHPTSIHVGESLPFWIDEQRQATAEFGAVVNQFGLEIREHLKLIKIWQSEAKGIRLSQLKPIKHKIKLSETPSQKTILQWMI